MDEYSYLSVLIAIILGLAITQILQGFRGLLHFRDGVTLYWPSIIWAFLILTIAVQSWWASFGLRRQTHWSFLGFAIVLLENICIYMGEQRSCERPCRRAWAGRLAKQDAQRGRWRSHPVLSCFDSQHHALNLVHEVLHG